MQFLQFCVCIVCEQENYYMLLFKNQVLDSFRKVAVIISLLNLTGLLVINKIMRTHLQLSGLSLTCGCKRVRAVALRYSSHSAGFAFTIQGLQLHVCFKHAFAFCLAGSSELCIAGDTLFGGDTLFPNRG